MVVVPFEADNLQAYILFAMGLTIIGLFSKYKIFLLFAVAPIFYLMFHSTDDTHEGYLLMMTSLAGWILFNIFVAFFGDKNE